MASIGNDIYDIRIALRTAYSAAPTYDAELLLIDSESVPVYDVYKAFTVDDFDDLTAGTAERNFAAAYFGQDLTPETLVLGRWTSAATPPAFICGTVDTTVATWEAIDAGAFTVVDSDSNSTAVSGIDFTGITAFSQVITKLNAALAALVDPAVVDLELATFALDVNGDLVLTMPSTQDDTDPTFTISFNASTGTIPYLLGLRVSGAGTAVEGRPVETLLEAYDRLKERVDFYNVAIADRTADSDEIVALAAQIETERRQMTVVDVSAEAVTSGDATDLQSLLSALSYDNTIVLYTEHDDYPDAAADGAFLPAEPGTRSYGHTPLSGVLASGSLSTNHALSTTDKGVLTTKGTNYLREDGGSTYVHRGKTAGGKEKRQVLGVHWMESTIQAAVHALDMNQDLLAFDAFTLGSIDGILRSTLDEAVKRRIIVSYEINLPAPEDFTAAEKASGDLELPNAFTAVGNFEAHTFTIRGSITLE